VLKIKPKLYPLLFIVATAILFFCILKLSPFKKASSNSSPETSIITPPPLTEISWDQAVSLLQECQIQTIFQKRNLEVTLTGKNNQVYKTIEPKFNDIIYQSNHLRSDCLDLIQKITE
jgi:hypothetical protein